MLSTTIENGVPYITDFTSIGIGVTAPFDVNYAGPTGYYTSIGIDSSDWVHAAYYDDGAFAREVQYALPLDAVLSETVDDEGYYVSLAVRSDDVPCVAFQAGATADLKYGCRDASSESWSLTTVDSVGAVGVDAALTFDASDDPWIAYYDESNGDLKVATRSGGRWTVIDVDTAGDVGRTPSIALDSKGYVHISYYDVTNGTLKYARGR